MKEIFAAFVKAQAELGAAVKDSTNPHYRSKYADMTSVVEAIRPVFAKYGLAYFQMFSECQGGVSIETVILHESGESMSARSLFIPASKHDPHGYASACTYARRISLSTAAGLTTADDDGNAAVATAPKISPVKSAMAEQVDEGWVVGQARQVEELLAQKNVDEKAVYEIYKKWNNEQRLALWDHWSDSSKIRSRLKALVDIYRQIEAQAAPEKVAA